MGWKKVSSLDGAEILPYNIFVLLVDLVERLYSLNNYGKSTKYIIQVHDCCMLHVFFSSMRQNFDNKKPLISV